MDGQQEQPQGEQHQQASQVEAEQHNEIPEGVRPAEPTPAGPAEKNPPSTPDVAGQDEHDRSTGNVNEQGQRPAQPLAGDEPVADEKPKLTFRPGVPKGVSGARQENNHTEAPE